jgi:hypothetical protein
MPKSDDWLIEQLAAERAREHLRLVDGRPYHQHCDQVRALVKAKALDEAAGLLLRLIEAIEREHDVPLPGFHTLPHWYYRELAKVYRKVGNETLAAEIERRYEVNNAKVKAASEAAKLRMRESIAADDPGPSAGVVIRRRVTAPAKKKSTNDGEKLGRAVGKLFRSIFK